MIIDMHTHIVPKDFPAAAGRPSGSAFPAMAPKDDERSAIIIGGAEYRVVRDVCWDAPKRAAEMTAQSTDKQALSPLPELLMHNLDPQDGAVMVGSDWQGTGPKSPSPEEEFAALGLSAEERDLIGWRNALRYVGA